MQDVGVRKSIRIKMRSDFMIDVLLSKRHVLVLIELNIEKEGIN